MILYPCMGALKRDRWDRGPRSILTKDARLHILARDHTAETLAKALGVSRATALRILDDLRRALSAHGSRLVSVRDASGWRYEIRHDRRRAVERDPLVTYVVPVTRRRRARWSKREDRDIYGRD